MKSLCISAHFFLSLAAIIASAGDTKSPSSPPPHISKETRMQLVRAFNAELVYIRAPFPMGKVGLKLKNGVLSPSREELQQLIAMWGPAAKPGDQARISDIIIKNNFIHFEINGGPVKKQKWYQRIQVQGAGGGTAPLAPSDSSANARGSFVDLYFDHYVPDLTGPQLKELLRPVFDFDAKSAVEAYLETVPPKVKDAIQNHQVLVGMNREMVIYSKGRPPKKVREKNGEIEYEDWIYGEPPHDVDFVRMIGDRVVRVETMKVNGEKLVRTEKEVDLEPEPSVAKREPPGPRPPDAPSLKRPGEELPDAPNTLTVPAKGTGSPSGAPPPSKDPNSVPN
jgi:hypothetical protein